MIVTFGTSHIKGIAQLALQKLLDAAAIDLDNAHPKLVAGGKVDANTVGRTEGRSDGLTAHSGGKFARECRWQFI